MAGERLQTLLKVRELQRDVAHAELLRSRRHLDHRQQCHHEAMNNLHSSALAPGELPEGALGGWAHRSIGVGREVRFWGGELDDAVREHHRSRDITTRATTRVEGLERLLQRVVEEDLSNQTRREQAELDDFVTQRRKTT